MTKREELADRVEGKAITDVMWGEGSREVEALFLEDGTVVDLTGSYEVGDQSVFVSVHDGIADFIDSKTSAVDGGTLVVEEVNVSELHVESEGDGQVPERYRGELKERASWSE